ncbi:MAG: bifunctional phosphoglucose/phosphomannose isomerase [Promethearchaeota archaeon]
MPDGLGKRADMLDDLIEMGKIDKSGMLELQIKVPEFARDAIKRARGVVIPSDIEIKGRKLKYYNFTRIIGAGMGGSAISFDFLKSFLRYTNVKIPVETNRDYNLPPYADENTLVILISYSGNTEETLNCFLNAIDKGCPIVALTSGGKLEAVCKKVSLPYVKLPSGLPPRASIPYLFFPLLIILEKLNIRPPFEEDIEETLSILETLRDELRPETLTLDNLAKRIAICLQNKIPLIYGNTFFDCVAYRLKCQFNENSKIIALSEVLPEMNHNGIMGWEADKQLLEPLYPIFIRDSDESPSIKARIEISRDQIILKKKKQVIEILARGQSILAKICSVTYIGDFTSVYLALLYGTDPTPVQSISLLKSKLAERTKITNDIQVRFNKL